jgi:hypothetical protein
VSKNSISAFPTTASSLDLDSDIVGGPARPNPSGSLTARPNDRSDSRDSWRRIALTIEESPGRADHSPESRSATVDSPEERPAHVAAPDPRGRFHKVRHHAGNPSGTYEDDSSAYWHEITEALTPAAAILALGHGSGKANASHHWVTYVEKHRPDVAAKLVADVRADIDHIDDRQILRLAQVYFGEARNRGRGDASA